MKRKYTCLLCKESIEEDDLDIHKKEEKDHCPKQHYGMMWPMYTPTDGVEATVRIHESAFFADEFGVKAFYVCDEGADPPNPSGSMKDYLVRRAIGLAKAKGDRGLSVVSSGNHAFSVVKFCQEAGLTPVVFVPASTSKEDALCSFPNVCVIGVKDAIVEEVYELAATLEFPGIYNANVCNEELLPGFYPVGNAIAKLTPRPTHILSGVGNGSYLAGIAYALECLGDTAKIVPVGMKGAFPTKKAIEKGKLIYEQRNFCVGKKLICAAEGSIALKSYSMPLVVHATQITNGFPLGGLLNEDLAKAYCLLHQEKSLWKEGIIPEPTGIMGLAACLKYKEKFTEDDVVMVSFTGHGVKDCEGIRDLVPDNIANDCIRRCKAGREDLVVDSHKRVSKPEYVDKKIGPQELRAKVERMIQ